MQRGAVNASAEGWQLGDGDEEVAAVEEELAGRTECRGECKWLLAAGCLQVGWPAAVVAAWKEGNNGR
ncbi:hypothetical protein MRB53_026091 [Persea americana]|uniref:Uncharacterized protein n=1 Tax=Persea americana TaxID=3435 RepID=A0ACC2LHD6_PERAE|nr:hypothetical protein MRB53_026091 [Persea americana]